MFLYVPDQAQSTASTAPRFTASLNDNRDDWCLGFDSEQLAAALNITTGSLFQANRHRELTLENVEASICQSAARPTSKPGAIRKYGPSANMRCGKEASGCHRRCRGSELPEKPVVWVGDLPGAITVQLGATR
jgi:hypothetical protein